MYLVKPPLLQHVTLLSGYLIMVGLCLVSVSSEAFSQQPVRQVAVAYVPHDSSEEPDEATKSAVIEKAKLKAWNKYTSKFNAAKMKRYLEFEDTFLQDLDQFIIKLTVVEMDLDPDAQSLGAVVRLEINDARLEAVMGNLSKAGQQASGDGSLFVFLFVARQGSDVTDFKEKKIDISKSEASSSAEESMAASETEMATSTSTAEMSKTTTGGSVKRKRSKTTYEVSSSEDIDAAMGEVLSTAGFEVVSYDDVVSECGGTERYVIADEFRESDEMSRPSRKGAIKASRECEVEIFATGTLDVGVQDTDSVTGNIAVWVNVRGQVWSIKKRLPRKIASVGPVQFKGEGPNDDVAKRNALILAAREASKAIVDQLNAKGIH